jgi:hypothetical protein
VLIDWRWIDVLFFVFCVFQFSAIDSTAEQQFESIVIVVDEVSFSHSVCWPISEIVDLSVADRPPRRRSRDDGAQKTKSVLRFA